MCSRQQEQLRPTKIEAIQHWPIPSDVTTLQQFLGLASYYWHYIQTWQTLPLRSIRSHRRPLYSYETKNVKIPSTLSKLPNTSLVLAFPSFSTDSDQFVLHGCQRYWFRAVLHVHVVLHIPYSLDQTPWILFISFINFVQLLFKSGVYFAQPIPSLT